MKYLLLSIFTITSLAGMGHASGKATYAEALGESEEIIPQNTSRLEFREGFTLKRSAHPSIVVSREDIVIKDGEETIPVYITWEHCAEPDETSAPAQIMSFRVRAYSTNTTITHHTGENFLLNFNEDGTLNTIDGTADTTKQISIISGKPFYEALWEAQRETSAVETNLDAAQSVSTLLIDFSKIKLGKDFLDAGCSNDGRLRPKAETF